METPTMIHPWHDVTPGEKLPREFIAIVEIPMGSSIKYELDKKTGLLKLDRVLFQQPLFRSGADSGETPTAAPEEISRDSQREQQGATDRVAGVGANRAGHDVGCGEQEQR